ncbi:MAG: aminomethyl-transferring glycine dehydrogenase subunit GcvPA [Acidimicrobiales bacterium]
MPTFIPHTETETSQMLADLGLKEIDEIFATIPRERRLGRGLNLPDGVSEYDVLTYFEEVSAKNLHHGRPLVSFAGGGSYDHDIPQVVRTLGSRGEFVTAYTPYQPEVAQGVLQALFEFQTLISRLSGLEISNASLYDGATATVEAVNLACAHTRSHHVIVSKGINPTYLQTVRTFAEGTGLSVEELPLNDDLSSDLSIETASQAAAVVVGYPNYFGVVEDLARARELANRTGALLICVYDPISLALLSSPGSFGVDVAVAEGQSLGTPVSFGGPYLGLFSVRPEYLRLVPGRLVGETVDAEGRRSFVTTLRTREQDIRRERASSNVCTNQTLMAVHACIYLSWLGPDGFRELATSCLSSSHYLADALSTIPGVELVTPVFVREFTIRLTGIDSEAVRSALADRGFLAGVSGEFPSGDLKASNTLILSATERRTKSEIDRFAGEFSKIVEAR